MRMDRGRLYGPGTFDMKAGLVQGVFAVEALRRCIGDPEVTPVFVYNSDEEIGSPDSREHIERLAMRADRALVLEPSWARTAGSRQPAKGAGTLPSTSPESRRMRGLNPRRG